MRSIGEDGGEDRRSHAYTEENHGRADGVDLNVRVSIVDDGAIRRQKPGSGRPVLAERLCGQGGEDVGRLAIDFLVSVVFVTFADPVVWSVYGARAEEIRPGTHGRLGSRGLCHADVAMVHRSFAGHDERSFRSWRYYISKVDVVPKGYVISPHLGSYTGLERRARFYHDLRFSLICAITPKMAVA